MARSGTPDLRIAAAQPGFLNGLWGSDELRATSSGKIEWQCRGLLHRASPTTLGSIETSTRSPPQARTIERTTMRAALPAEPVRGFEARAPSDRRDQ